MRKFLPLSIAFLTILSCHKNNDNSITDPPTKDTIPIPPVVDTIPQIHVYICGYEIRKAFYWKDSTIVYLTDGKNAATATAIFVKDTDVYVAGSEMPAPYKTFAAKYWKNGVPVSLTDGSRYATTTGIYVDENKNVYVSGWEQSAAGYNDMHWIAKYWVNGKEHILSDSAVNDGVATGIVADKIGNVFVSWWQFNAGGQRLGFYNKNEQKHLLNIEGFNLYPLDITEDNGDVYVIGSTNNGYDKNYAGYWKNGQLVIIDSVRQAWLNYGSLARTIYTYWASGIEIVNNCGIMALPLLFQ